MKNKQLIDSCEKIVREYILETAELYASFVQGPSDYTPLTDLIEESLDLVEKVTKIGPKQIILYGGQSK